MSEPAADARLHLDQSGSCLRRFCEGGCLTFVRVLGSAAARGFKNLNWDDSSDP